MFSVSVAAAVLMACGGSSPGGTANDAGPYSASQTPNAVTAVSLSMNDYLGSTVVLYFSFPG